MTRRWAAPFGTLTAIACAIALTHAAPSEAQPSDDDARRHFEAGESYFKTSDYDGALKEFGQAYQLADPKNRPPILLSIASVHERMGDLPKTVETLKKWQAEAPADHKDRGTVGMRIQNLEKRIEEQKAAAAAAAPTNTAPASAATTAPATTETAPVAPPPAPAAEPNHTPAYISWGVGGAAAIGAAVTGYLAQKKYDDADSGCAQTPQGCSDSDVSPIKSMALVSTILTGVAIAGAGVGTYFYLTATPPKQETASGVVPWVSAGVTPRGGGFDATWRF